VIDNREAGATGLFFAIVQFHEHQNGKWQMEIEKWQIPTKIIALRKI
jgi:hypothetical protein